MKKTKTKKVSVLFSLFILFLSAGLFFIFPFMARAAELFVDPQSGNRRPGDIFPVTLMIRSTDQAVNSVSATFDFPSDIMEVISVSQKGSVIDLWSTGGPSFSNRYGTVDLEGVILEPGFKGVAGELLTINFKVNKEGEAVLQYFYPEIYANNGQENNLVSTSVPARFLIEEQKFVGGDLEEVENKKAGDDEEPLTASSSEVDVLPAVKVKSSTHPDPEKWYKEDTVELFWEMPDQAEEVKILANMFSTTSPKIHYDYRLASKTIEDLSDGEWFFHIQLKNDGGWGDISHFPFKIDTIPPAGLEISEASSSGQFSLSARDGLSGMDRYEINIDNSSSTYVVEAEEPALFHASGLEAGDHTMYVKAFDKAGNHSEGSKNFDLQTDIPILKDKEAGEVKSGNEITEKSSLAVEKIEEFDWKDLDISLWQAISAALGAFSLFLAVYSLILKRRLRYFKRSAYKKMKIAEKVLNRVYASVFDQVEYLEGAKKRKKRLTTQESNVLKELKDALEEVEKEYK